MKIWMAASECSPWAKSGGLGDAVSALSRELTRRGHDVRVFIPGYSTVDRTGFGFHDGFVSAPVGHYLEPGELRSLETPEGMIVTLVESAPFFDRRGLYGEHGIDYPDNDRRFTYFNRVISDLAVRAKPTSPDRPDVLHSHDWQSALIPFFVRNVGAAEGRRPATVFSVHNAGYQGSFPVESLEHLGMGPDKLEPFLHGGPLEFYGRFNFLKTGLRSCDLANTVSPTHAKETCTEALGFGLDGIFRSLGDRYTGILNGIDTAEWNPENDRFLTTAFGPTGLAGKGKLKAETLAQFGLRGYPDDPLIGIVSRLVWQKGIDVVLETAGRTIERGAKLIVLGSGDSETEAGLLGLARRYPDRVAVRIGFSEALSHLVTAASDLLLVPSRYEPCGLVQMQAMRYGTLPVATRTGGLADTVTDLQEDPAEGTGFLFDGVTPAALHGALGRAVDTYWQDRAGWQAAQRRAMARDFSWGRAAAAYEALYDRALALSKP